MRHCFTKMVGRRLLAGQGACVLLLLTMLTLTACAGSTGLAGTLPRSPSPAALAIEASPSSSSSHPGPSPEPQTGLTTPAAAPEIPDLTPPAGGWLAFLTLDDCLALISPDGSRAVPLCQLGKVDEFIWSPSGDWLAYQAHAGPVGLVSLKRSSVTIVDDGWWGHCPTWSQDSLSLAYLSAHWSGGQAAQAAGALPTVALRVYELASGQALTVTTIPDLARGGIPQLYPQPFPAHLVPVSYANNIGSGNLYIWDTQTGIQAGFVTIAGTSWDVQTSKRGGVVNIVGACSYLWLPGGKGLLFAREDLDKKPVVLPWTQNASRYPQSLMLWRPGEASPTLLLEAAERQTLRPVGWLPDGRLEVCVRQWDRESYDQPPGTPEQVAYRYFNVSEGGELQETPAGELPWWAAGRVEAVAPAQLPGPAGQASPSLGRVQVSPDGTTVAFSWQWGFGQGSSALVAVYLWRGEGQPVRLTMGYGPQWQPVQGQP